MAIFLNQLIKDSHNRLLSLAEYEEPPYTYLLGRGCGDVEITRFEIGFFTGKLVVRDESQDFEQFNKQTGYGKRLQQRLIFPLTNARGQLRGFESRSYFGKKSYFKYTLMRNQVDAWFFGLRQALPAIWESKSVFLTEGIFDLFPLARIWPNTICAATVNINPVQIEFFARFVDTLYVVLDEDEHGTRNFHKLQKQLPNHDVVRLHNPSKDLSELWQKMGDEGFRNILMKEYERVRV